MRFGYTLRHSSVPRCIRRSSILAVTDGLVTAVNGDDLTFTVGEGVMVNNANVILADVQASNGIIHVIDKVLMPPVPVTEADGDVCYNMYTHTSWLALLR